MQFNITQEGSVPILESCCQISKSNNIRFAKKKNSNSIVEIPPIEESVDIRIVDSFDHSPRKFSSNEFKNFDSIELRVFVVDNLAVQQENEMRQLLDGDFSRKLETKQDDIEMTI